VASIGLLLLVGDNAIDEIFLSQTDCKSGAEEVSGVIIDSRSEYSIFVDY